MYCNTILLHCIGNFWSYLWYSHVYALYFQKSAKIVEFKPYIYAINDASSAWCMAVISRFIRILLLLPYCSLVPFCRFIRILREFFLLHELDSTPVFLLHELDSTSGRTRGNQSRRQFNQTTEGRRSYESEPSQTTEERHSYESEPSRSHHCRNDRDFSPTTGRLYDPVSHTHARNRVDPTRNMSPY
jgi:hypothetical protein